MGRGEGTASSQSHGLEVVRGRHTSLMVNSTSSSSRKYFQETDGNNINLCQGDRRKNEPGAFSVVFIANLRNGHMHSRGSRARGFIHSPTGTSVCCRPWATTEQTNPLPPWSSPSMERRQTRKELDVRSGPHKCHEEKKTGTGQKVETQGFGVNRG